MVESAKKAIAVVGMGAILPDAPDVATFWKNLQVGRYSITEVPENRWDPALYYDPDPSKADKTYSKIGGWVWDYKFDPMNLGIPIPPRVLAAMDESQQWAISVSYQALKDYGYPERPLNTSRTAVILGNALAGEKHYISTMRIHTPEFQRALKLVPAFQSLAPDVQQALLQGMQRNIYAVTPEITEDTMPGELGNIIAGRVANVFNLGGPNFVTDAACASSFAALQSAMEGLISHRFDAAISGGVDRNMGIEGFVKFSKIGALSPDGSRPYAEGANGFVMGEGAALFLLKRLEDAEKDGDRIYAVIRGIGGSSDGKGKGITAPNPIGPQRAIERAWQDAGLSPAEASYIEGHGTSTRVGDVVEMQSMMRVFEGLGVSFNKVPLGSVKSNIGHLKSAAGAAGLLKTILSLSQALITPNVNFERPNPNIDFAHSAFYVNTETHDWHQPQSGIRRAGVSSFGFGGTNFHVVVEEYLPGLLTSTRRVFQAPDFITHTRQEPAVLSQSRPLFRGLYFESGEDQEQLRNKVVNVINAVKSGTIPPSEHPSASLIAKNERLVVDYETHEELLNKLEKTLPVFESHNPKAWQMLSAQGIFRGSGQPGKLAFLFPGQGSQYVNMLRELRDLSPIVADTFKEADEVMQPLLGGRKLSSYIFVDGDEQQIKQAEDALRDTAITQPAVLTSNVALMRLLKSYGFSPDYVIGHSLGEYAALVTAGVLTFEAGLVVVSARGREMSKVSMDDNGCMAAVSGPIEQVEALLKRIDGYVVIANINSPSQSVIGGATRAVDQAIEIFKAEGYEAQKIPVSHAFHTRIVAPASQPLRQVIARMQVQRPEIPVIANVTGDLYPTEHEEILDFLARQVASPVQFVKGMQKLYAEGVRTFLEVGPKRVLSALASDNLRGMDDVTILYSNHPRKGALPALNEALCGLYAAGVVPQTTGRSQISAAAVQIQAERPQQSTTSLTPHPVLQVSREGKLPLTGSVVISGAGLGLPGRDTNVFSDDNIDRILNGEMRIDPLPDDVRQSMLEKRVTRLDKNANGAEMVMIDDLSRTIKLAGQRGAFDLAEDFGVPASRVEALDISTQLAIAAGIEALRDAGIPLVMRYRLTSKGTYLPDRWMLPEALADETGVIFGSAFPGLDRMSQETDNFYAYQSVQQQLENLKQLRESVPGDNGALAKELERQIEKLSQQLEEIDYHFDRRFIFRILTMGHSQFAEYIGARGPNTHVNAACATTTHAIAIAEDWIRNGRCRRVVVVAGDDVTSGSLAKWVGTGLLATGATTIEGDLEHAALPFDRRRNGMIMGMGGAALVVESEDAVRERGMHAIAEILATQIANSAFHGTRLDVDHVSQVMQRLVSQSEERFGLRREEMAPNLMFMSHETYTPARGGSAAAEIHALRAAFGDSANKVVISNTKGFTGHTMGVGIEDVVATKALQKGIVPPIANITNGFEPDPDLGDLNLSRGGKYPLQYALRLGAGFGSQVAMVLLRRLSGEEERVDKSVYQPWLADMAGYEAAELEVEKRTLHIRDDGPPQRSPAASHWQPGQVPMLRAALPDAAKPEGEEVAISLNVDAQQAVAVELPTVTADMQQIRSFILDLVSEKTGYPTEMLDEDLDLEADLGVDTVKQAELFSAVREEYRLPRREDLRLSDYNTLAKVVSYVEDGLSGTAKPEAAAPIPMDAAQVNQQKSLDEAEIKEFLLNLVSEKTGYPVDMLDLDLDLEADLGVDTVKQAELFASVRDKYQIPRREDLRLSDYNTLAKVIQFVKESEPGEQPQNQAAPSAVAPVRQDEKKPIEEFVLQLVSEKTGYPVEMLDLDLDLEADLGVDTVKQAELFSTVRDRYQIPRREDLRLSDYNTLAKVIQFVKDSETDQQSQIQPAPATVEPEQEDEEKHIEEFVLQLVSEKTGYPVEMLDLDLDLEADLGVDTVKQAELFSTVRDRYQIPRREDLRLSDYNTLAKVIQFVSDSLEQKKVKLEQIEVVEKQPEPQLVKSKPELSQPKTADPTAEHVKILRRVPVPVLRPRLDVCVPTAVTFEEGKRWIIVKDEGGVWDSLAHRLRARKVQVLAIEADTPASVEEQLADILPDNPIHGVYFLPALDCEASLEEMDFTAWHAELEKRVHVLYTLMRTLAGDVPLISATRMGGLHGFGDGGATAPLGGAVSGFTKAYAREHRGTTVKVIDFDPAWDARLVAEKLVEEALNDPGAVEIGWEDKQRFTISLVERPTREGGEGTIDANSVYLVTGGAGGITVPIIEDLARNSGGIFYLADRIPEPDMTDPDLERVLEDKDAFRQELIARKIAEGSKLSPVQLEQMLTKIERAAGIKRILAMLSEAGASGKYLSSDVTDPAAVGDLVARIQSEQGHLDVVIHTAGVEKSHLLEQKPPEEFQLVFSVKTDGFFNLVKAVEKHHLSPKAFVSFTSIAGRFGNAGQTDYSAANDLMSKLGLSLKRAFPKTHFLSIDWSAWSAVGMSSRGSLPELMRRAGIDMVHPDDAVPLVRAELLAGSHGEVVLAGALGILLKPRYPESGLDLERANCALTEGEPVHVMLSRVTGLDLYQGIKLEVELDPTQEPFLKDHSLNGIPVLPGVMGIEGFSIAAMHIASCLGTRAQGFHVSGLEDVQFLAPFKFYRGEPRRVTWLAQVIREPGGLVAPVTLESTLISRIRPAEKVVHFKGRVHMEPVEQKPSHVVVTPPTWKKSPSLDRSDIYRLYFHGPSFQVLDSVQSHGDMVLGRLSRELPPITKMSNALLTTPLLIELALQTAGVWEIGKTGVLSLPVSIRKIDLYQSEINGEQIFAEVQPIEDGDTMRFNARVVDQLGQVYLELQDYRTAPLPYAAEEKLVEPLRKLIKKN